MSESRLSSVDAHPRKRLQIVDTEMSYVGVGQAIRSGSCTAIRHHPISGEISFRRRSGLSRIHSYTSQRTRRTFSPEKISKHAETLFKQQ